jgi:hypothetical protein
MSSRDSLAAAFYHAKAHPTARYADLFWNARQPYLSDADIALAWMADRDAKLLDLARQIDEPGSDAPALLAEIERICGSSSNG